MAGVSPLGWYEIQAQDELRYNVYIFVITNYSSPSTMILHTSLL